MSSRRIHQARTIPPSSSEPAHDETFGRQLKDEISCTRAKAGADDELEASLKTARREKTADIRTGDDQYQNYRAEQQDEGLLEISRFYVVQRYEMHGQGVRCAGIEGHSCRKAILLVLRDTGRNLWR